MTLVDIEYFIEGFGSSLDATLHSALRQLALTKTPSVQGCSSFSKSVAHTYLGCEPKEFKTNKHGVDYTYSGNVMHWDVMHALDLPVIKQVIDDFTVEMIRNRSRVATIGSGEGLITELNYKIATQRALRDGMPEVDSELEFELFIWLLGEMLNALTMDHWKTFQTEHKNSSLRPGYTWSMVTEADAKELYEYWKQALRYLIDQANELQDMYWNRLYHLGMRARTIEPFDPKQERYKLWIDRTRMVLFEQHQSTLFAFINPVSYDAAKKQMIDKWMAQTGLKAYQAYTQGAAVYVEMAKLKHLPFRGYDGISWETFVSLILKWAKPFCAAYDDDVIALYTGGGFTSLLGVLAALALFRHLMTNVYPRSEVILIGNSDDMGMVFVDGKPFAPPIPLDENKADTQLKFMLGVAYVAENPHPVGIKLTRDKSDGHVPYREPMETLFRDLTQL